VEDGRAVEVTGDTSSPIHRGFTCEKGRALPDIVNSPSRLLRTVKRGDDGTYSPIGVSDAIAEIAERIRAILAEHGPRSVALYTGTKAMANPASLPLADAFFDAIGSPMRFTPNTIDQPGKHIAKGFHGSWMAPAGADEADVTLNIGCNPFSAFGAGAPVGNPGAFLKRARERGAKSIVVDPRRTQFAAKADIHLQIRPGQDVAVLAGILHVILGEGLYDADFVAENVDGLDRLRSAVEPYSPSVAAERAGIDADDLIAAARLFAGARRGLVVAGTGPSMGTAYGPLVEYLILTLDTVCGNWPRAGELVRNPGVLVPTIPRKAQASPPIPAFEFGERMRVRGLSQSLAGVPTAALADEILLPGEGQIRALIVLNGNPVASIPDQLRTIEAMEALDLLVTLDITMSQTSRYADYVIAPPMSLEVPGLTMPLEFLPFYGNGRGFADAAAQYAPPVVPRPEGSELIEEWEFFYDLAVRLGLQLNMPAFPMMPFPPVPLDMQSKPTTDELFDLMCENSRIPLSEVRKNPSVAYYPDPQVFVAPKDPGWEGRLNVGDPHMMQDLADCWRTDDVAAPLADGFDFRLLSRRLRYVLNSSYNISATNRGRTNNLAYLHPDDLAMLGLDEHDTVTISSAHGSIPAIVAADKAMSRGTVSMAHGFGGGGATDEGDFVTRGSSTNRLISLDVVYDRYSGQPLMSNLPVKIERAPALV
jgi:anaerobic selenocysteine-containing dehydrogenase